MTIHPIDLHFQGQSGVITAFLLHSGQDYALIETGPASCHAALLAGLRNLGLEASAIRQVFITHIHLDHAGGTGWWAQQGAQVYVHGKGAPHVIDPARLIESAARIYGDQMQTLWGEILPAPAERVTSLADGDRVPVGDVVLEAWDTPGHARHHLAFVGNDVCFTGDVAGVRIPGCHYLSVAAAPPQFEPEPYVASVERLQSARFQALHLTHGSKITDVQDHLKRYAGRIREVYHRIADWKRQGLDSGDIQRFYTESEHAAAQVEGVSEQDWRRYELANNAAMCASGIELFVSKHPA